MRILKTSSHKKVAEAAALAYRLGGKTFEDIVLSSEALWVVLDDDNEVVGAAGASVSRGRLILTICFLSPKARGYGFQKKLIDLRLRWGRKQGCKIAYTYTYRRNHASMISLLKNNFSPYYVDKSNYAYFARYL
jgi:GNAT superfamily N-acetyltransferase